MRMGALYTTVYLFVLRYPYTQAHVYLQFSYHSDIFWNKRTVDVQFNETISQKLF